MNLFNRIKSARRRLSGVSGVNYKTLYPVPGDIGSVYTGGSGVGGMVRSAAELATAITAISAAGGTIVIDSVVSAAGFGKVNITTTPTNRIMIRGESTSARGKVGYQGFLLGKESALVNASKYTLKWLDLGDNVSTATAACLSFGDWSGTGPAVTTDVYMYECSLYGPTLDVGWPVDTTNYATVAPAAKNGTDSHGSGTVMSGFIVGYCDFHDLFDAVGQYINGVFIGNTFDKIYSDNMRIASVTGQGAKLYFNKITRTIGLPTDIAAPHSDGLQMYGSGTSNPSGIELIGNIVFNYGSRGTNSGFVSFDLDAGYYIHLSKFVGNIAMMPAGVAHTISFQRAADCYSIGNASLDYTLAPQAGCDIRVGYVEAAGINGFFYNLGGTNSAGTPKKVSDFATGTAAHMDGPANPTTVAGVITACRWAAGEYLRNYIDYTNFTVDTSLEIGWVPFVSLIGVAVNSTTASGWKKIMGGPATQNISVAGGTYAIADDEAGTNATAPTTSPGTVTLGKYLQLQHTASASATTTTTTTLTLNSYANLWSKTTA